MNDLITIDKYKQAKAISKSDQDERISSIITGVSQLIKTYCGNTFNDYVATAKEEYVRNLFLNVEAIQLNESPIIEVESIYTRATITDTLEKLTANVDYVVDLSSDSIYRIGTNWPTGITNILVTYTCGYAEIPGDLELAAIDLVTYYLKEEHKKTQSIGSATRVNVSTTSLKNNTGFPDHIRRVLDMYRQI